MRNLKLYSDDYFYDPSFPLKILRRDPELAYPLHSHDFYEMVIIAAGSGIHFGKTHEFELRPGNVFVISPGMEHGYKDIKGLVLYNILFSPSLFGDKFFDLRQMAGFQALFYIEPSCRTDTPLTERFLQLSPSQMAEIMPMLDSIMAETDSMEINAGSRAMAFAKMLQFLVFLFRTYENSTAANPDHRKIMRLAEVFSYIESHLDSTITTEELMDKAAMSASTLNRYFKKATGLSPVEYQIHKRIELACMLMRSTDLSMMLISDRTGFSDSNYFTRTFRKVMGVTPSRYRSDKTLWY
ncbi:MAG: helix-turn-helix domain-containing protein [Sphaerochaetaceae bacterium]